MGITKGRDFAFSGAVDGLTINADTYDCEPFGVQEVPSRVTTAGGPRFTGAIRLDWSRPSSRGPPEPGRRTETSGLGCWTRMTTFETAG